MSLRLLTCFFTSKKLGRIQNRSRDAHVAGIGLREQKYTRRLRPSEEKAKTLPEMENPARNDAHATQARLKKQRGKCRRKRTAIKSKRKAQLLGLPSAALAFGY